MISHPLTTLFTSAILLRTSIAGYALTDTYASTTFFGNFTAYTGPDPTSGFVKFTDYNTAITTGLIGTVTNAQNASYLGVDTTSLPSSSNSTTTGRPSIRIESTKLFNKGLFLADIAHLPVGCGTWPAFWLLGANRPWPTGGEIDIIEGVNPDPSASIPHPNQMTLHTDANCKIWNKGSLAHANTTNCDSNAAGQSKNAGCAYNSADPASFGPGFNAAGGGVYATEWTSEAISIFFFPRSRIPADITSGNAPDPSKWGTPMAHFCGGPGYCDIDAHFKDMRIIFDTTFCGQWAGDQGVWGGGSCGRKAGSCEGFVRERGGELGEAYWLVNSVKVFQEQNGGAGGSGNGSAKVGGKGMGRRGVRGWRGE